ncbi:MAG: ClpXP protease specificity-enhancing factor [Gammaproteobacteria bacterium]|nr:ClpXP protease specificity-enhancing factor [Gammaproteobacteria bacterium]
MTSSRPYLIRAIYQWIVDNNSTPHLLVDVAVDGVEVPNEHIDNGKIILNVGPMAVQNLILGNDSIEFSARFSGQSRLISVPSHAVLAIYARENGQGMVFNDEPRGDTPIGAGKTTDINSGAKKADNKSKKPNLRIVK